MADKVSLVGQISEIDREIRMREQLYPRWIAERKMRSSEADMAMERIRAVRASLQFLQKHEAEIRAMFERKQTAGGQA